MNIPCLPTSFEGIRQEIPQEDIDHMQAVCLQLCDESTPTLARQFSQILRSVALIGMAAYYTKAAGLYLARAQRVLKELLWENPPIEFQTAANDLLATIDALQRNLSIDN